MLPPKVALGLSVAAASGVGSALLLRALAQRRNAARVRIPDGGLDEAGWVTLHDQDQWVTVRGHDRAAPVLLFLHGGPGAAMSLLSYRHIASWERHFTIVGWDQRGAGRTFGRHGKARSGALTVEQLVTDGIALVEHLCARLGRRRILLFGHSWGSILGVEMVRRRPDLFSAYVGAGQVIDVARGEALSYAATVDRLRARGDMEGVAALDRIGPPYARMEGLRTQRRLLVSTMPEPERRFIAERTSTLLLSPSGSLRDIADFFGGFTHSLGELWSAISGWRIDLTGKELGVPAFFFVGEDDLQTPAELVIDYATRLHAPASEVVTFPGAAHFAYATHAEAFLRDLVARVRPSVEERG